MPCLPGPPTSHSVPQGCTTQTYALPTEKYLPSKTNLSFGNSLSVLQVMLPCSRPAGSFGELYVQSQYIASLKRTDQSGGQRDTEPTHGASQPMLFMTSLALLAMLLASLSHFLQHTNIVDLVEPEWLSQDFPGSSDNKNLTSQGPGFRVWLEDP